MLLPLPEQQDEAQEVKCREHFQFFPEDLYSALQQGIDTKPSFAWKNSLIDLSEGKEGQDGRMRIFRGLEWLPGLSRGFQPAAQLMLPIEMLPGHGGLAPLGDSQLETSNTGFSYPETW